MKDNTSLVGGKVLLRQINDRVLIVQMLVMVFLCINLLLISMFFKNESFYTTTRYILFAVNLLSDSFLLVVSDILLILVFFNLTFQVWLCVIICFVLIVYTTVTPVTLTAMTLERYVAVCMPLRHGEICSTRNTINCILIIHALSSVPSIFIFSAIFGSASVHFYQHYNVCSVEIFILFRWQDNLRSAVYQIFFLIMCIIIVFCYVKIMKVAKAASGKDKRSSRKGLRTVALHGFQLLLCLIQLLCPFIETAIFAINLKLFIDVRYINYIMFNLAPKCLSPLVYGLWDETFSHALKKNVFCGFIRRNI
ncbi:odorant receptor 131-2-like [Echeneis naucrates]|uniref:odorant receptor 131-2-like n=1 Tax=Echeneis naucrates TaxID=173247 RepID=UPI001113714A|nr:odorant receptor 131-2-like [Echeneis naucrates]